MRLDRKLGAFGGIVVLAGIVGTAGLTGAGAAQALARDPGGEVERAMALDGPILTAAEERMIEARCGYSEGEWNRRDIRVEDDGVLLCGNGRRVADPEVGALAVRIEQRVEARVASVLRRPEVSAAMSGEIKERIEREMREIEPRIEAAMRAAEEAGARARAGAALAEARFGPAERARLRTDVQRVRRELDRIDFDAVGREIDEALESDLRRFDPGA